MKVAVWDTYITRTDGRMMHFDIIAPSEIKDKLKIFNFGREYLQSKNQAGQTLETKECQFCHIESASDEVIESIKQRGYYILEMQNCD
jgi:hypothetical protein